MRVPGDKSISHRAVLLGAVSDRPIQVQGFLRSADTLATVAAVRALGVRVEEQEPETLHIHGTGWDGLAEPDDVIDVRNAGTLMRLLPGLVAPCPFLVVLTGDASIRRRPMSRVLGPLAEMGASVWGRDGDRLPPVGVRGGDLRGITHRMTVASAQVKSCILLAGLRARGETTVVEPGPSRDHTERLIRAAGGRVEREGPPTGPGTVRVTPVERLALPDLRIPGDFSSAAFPLVAALLVPDSEVTVEALGLNPTRTGLLAVLGAMGARLTVVPVTEPAGAEAAGGEPLGAVTAATSDLAAVEIGGGDVPLMIDELPIWALAAARARGISRLRDARELRVKESDRLAAVAALLRALGIRVEEHDDGLDIEGRPDGWEGGTVVTHGDHRLAMVGGVAGLASRRGVAVDDIACIDVSFPGFIDTMNRLTNGGEAA
ncbi:MAG: 3-phosphoshikimate 1-carboxyvinyltransferase [Thermoleophilia bacterium]